MNTTTETPAISKVDFMGNNLMILHLRNGRTVLVPLEQFPPIARLTAEERENFEIIDEQLF